MGLTTGDLKRILAGLPDDLPVLYEYDGNWSHGVALFDVRGVRYRDFDGDGEWVDVARAVMLSWEDNTTLNVEEAVKLG